MFKRSIILTALFMMGLSIQYAFAQNIRLPKKASTLIQEDSLKISHIKIIGKYPMSTPGLTLYVSKRSLRHGDEPHEGLHFAHPLFTESISPDTKFRFDYRYQSLSGNITRSGPVFGGEYAFNRSLSIEASIPYEFLNTGTSGSHSRLGNMEVSFKFANYAFENSGLLLGYGLEFGLPTGNDHRGIGSNHILEVAPFLNAGLKKGAWEWTGFATFGIPTNQEAGQDIETELELNFAGLYHVNERWQGVWELNGRSNLSGAGEGPAWFLSPGFKVSPLENKHIIAGLGVQIPLLKDSEQSVGLIGSVFYHF